MLVGTRLSPANVTKALHYLNLASEAKNPAAMGLEGYVLLLQHLRAAHDIIELHDGDLSAGQRYSQSDAIETKVARLLKLLRHASKKNDVNGVLGLGLAYFHGVGVSANMSKAVEHIQRTMGAHIDAGYHMGEICMGLKSMELSATSQHSMTHKTSATVRSDTGVTTDGFAQGKNSLETRIIEGHKINHAISQKTIDPAAATRGYSISAQMGHILAQHK